MRGGPARRRPLAADGTSCRLGEGASPYWHGLHRAGACFCYYIEVIAGSDGDQILRRGSGPEGVPLIHGALLHSLRDVEGVKGGGIAGTTLFAMLVK